MALKFLFCETTGCSEAVILILAFHKKTVLKHFTKLAGQYLPLSPLFNELHAWNLQLCWKRDPSTSVFLWILRNFEERLFYRTTLVAASETFVFGNNLFCKKIKQLSLVDPKLNLTVIKGNFKEKKCWRMAVKGFFLRKHKEL